MASRVLPTRDSPGGDIAAAVKGWLTSTGRMKADADLTHLEVRGWKPNPNS